MNGRRRVLFVSEDVTLAQVVRLATLSASLDPSRYEVHFACREFPALVFGDSTARQWPLETVDKEAALRRLAKGERMYDEKTLLRYVEAELTLLDAVRPDLVVGDFRMTLQVSAAHRKVPLATLINAYWSPFAVRDAFPVPDHPIVNFIGHERAARYMPQALPRAFAHFAAPLARVRRRFGLQPVDGLLEQLTAGDITLYADVPELCPVAGAPETHHFLGAVPWSPKVPLPAWWQELRTDVPLVYVTLGSSGAVSAMPALLEALGDLPLQVVLSSAGRDRPARVPANVRVTEYLPGDLAARRSLFVVTNGGSASVYQALVEGVPVLGIPFNLDQYLTMAAVERASAGVHVRAGIVNATALRSAAQRLMESGELRQGARNVSAAFARYDARQRFRALVEHYLPPSTRAEQSSTMAPGTSQ